MKKYAVEIALLSIALLLVLVVLIMPRASSDSDRPAAQSDRPSGFHLGFGEGAPAQAELPTDREWDESEPYPGGPAHSRHGGAPDVDDGRDGGE